MVKIFSFLLIVIYSSSEVQSQDINVTAFVDSANYIVGDYINFTIQVEHSEGTKVNSPLLKDSLAVVELISEKESFTEKRDGKEITTFQYIISKYDSSDVTIHPLPVFYQLKGETKLNIAYTNPVSFTVHTLNVHLDEEIKDVKEPVTIPLDWKVILLWFLIALIIIAAAIFIYLKFFKKKRKEIIEPIIYIPPYERALNSLNELDQKRLWQKGQIKEYHTTITEIIRRYFEEQFLLPALELPTSEIIENLQKKKELNVILDTTEDFFNNADLVKFAKFEPMNTVNEKMMDQANEIIKVTMLKSETEFKSSFSNKPEEADVQ